MDLNDYIRKQKQFTIKKNLIFHLKKPLKKNKINPKCTEEGK